MQYSLNISRYLTQTWNNLGTSKRYEITLHYQICCIYLSLQKELELGVDPTHFVPNLNEQKLANKSLASIFHQVFLLEIGRIY